MARTHRISDAGSEARSVAVVESAERDASLDGLACPNRDCCDFNQFGAGNLSVSDWIGKGKVIRRLYCCTCKKRFSERKGSLMEEAKLPEDVVVRIVKCLGHGCSVEATADICEVDPRTVQRYTKVAGQRSADFHQLQLERLEEPPPVVELDELHGRVSRPPQEKKGRRRRRRR